MDHRGNPKAGLKARQAQLLTLLDPGAIKRFVCTLLVAVVAACGAPTQTSRTPAPPPLTQSGDVEMPDETGPKVTDPITIVAVLPLSGPQGSLGQAMANAVEMAFFAAADPRIELFFLDSQGSDATEASRVLLLSELKGHAPSAIVGPLFSQTAQAIAPWALGEGIPVLSFSNDMAANAAGAILLGQQPEQEVERVLKYVSAGLESRRLGVVVPETVYGARVRKAANETVEAMNADLIEAREAALAQRDAERRMQGFDPRGPRRTLPDRGQGAFEDAFNLASADGPGADEDPDPLDMPLDLYTVVEDEAYERSLQTLDTPVRKVAQYYKRTRILENERAYLKASGDPLALDYLDSIRALDVFGPPGYDALLIGEGGQILRALAPLLTVYAVDEQDIQFIGTGLWNDPSLSREPALHGALYAAPAQHAGVLFSQRYEAEWGTTPPLFASLAYDAFAAAALAARDDDGQPAVFEPSRLFRSSGFAGASGLFRIAPSGICERVLAVMKITESGLKLVDPAPSAFPPPNPASDQLARQSDPLSR